MSGREAETKFWKTPELVERLLSFLDARSITRLAKLHKLTLDLIQRPVAWDKLMRGSVSDDSKYWEWDEPELEQFYKEDVLAQALLLVEISRMFEDPKPFQLDLLHLICERNPPNIEESAWINFGEEVVSLACCCNQTHSVSPLAFLILDEILQTLGSAEQSVERVHLSRFLENWQWLPEIMRRAACQQEMVEEVNIGTIYIDTKQTAEFFSALIENCRKMCFNMLEIEAEIGADGWAAIRKALEHQGRIFQAYEIVSTKRAMVQGGRDDMRAIWESLGQRSSWFVNKGHHWTRLESLEMLEDELDSNCCVM